MLEEVSSGAEKQKRQTTPGTADYRKQEAPAQVHQDQPGPNYSRASRRTQFVQVYGTTRYMPLTNNVDQSVDALIVQVVLAERIALLVVFSVLCASARLRKVLQRVTVLLAEVCHLARLSLIARIHRHHLVGVVQIEAADHLVAVILALQPQKTDVHLLARSVVFARVTT